CSARVLEKPAPAAATNLVSHNRIPPTVVFPTPDLSSCRRDVDRACGGAIGSGGVAMPPWLQTPVSFLPA
ncbi:hypothetical protein A2U01_0058198, partial [Trifolium medium]|nr:hypothetical protein [Trifolium medium]